MANNDTGTILALLLAFLVFTGLKKAPPGPGPGPGPVGSGGSIGKITVSNAAMGQPTKYIGVDSGVLVTVSGMSVNTTVDGVATPWTYAIRLYEYITGGAEIQKAPEVFLTAQPSGPIANRTWQYALPSVVGTYNLRVALMAASSTPGGTPVLGSLIQIATLTLAPAYFLKNPAVVISTGLIGGVVGAQQHGQRVYVRGHFRKGVAASQGSANIFAGRR